MAISSPSQPKIAVVTIHGTGDTSESIEGKKWYQRGSHFSQALTQKLATRGVTAEIEPFLWSGGNSAHERELAAEKLAAKIKRIAPEFSGVHLVGHSHGGNVANDAAAFLRWGRGKGRLREVVTSLTTIGTPFLRSRSSRMQAVGGVLFLSVTLVSAPLYLLSSILLTMWALSETTWGESNILPWGSADPLNISNSVGPWIDKILVTLNSVGMKLEAVVGAWFFVLLWLVCIGIPLWFMLRLALRGWRHITRPSTAAGERASVYAIWHRNDEAISFLQRVDALPVQPFPSGSVYRGSRSAALNAGVTTVVLAPIVAGVVVAWPKGALSEYALPLPALRDNIVMALFVGPPLFAVVYLLIRFLFASAGEHVARPGLNNWIADVLRGIAFGRDNDMAIGEVNTRSHTHVTKEHVIEGELALRMLANAEAASAKLIERYRWAIFTVGGDSNAPLTDVAQDAMTWSSLIHTTYFDQPEVADLIGGYIAEEVEAATARGQSLEEERRQTSMRGRLRAASSASVEAARALRDPRRLRTLAASAAALLVVPVGLASAIALSLVMDGAPRSQRQSQSASQGTQSSASAQQEPVVQAGGSSPSPANGADADAEALKDCELCPVMVMVKEGRFEMGSAENDPERQPWEGPKHRVDVPTFLISEREVTVGQWRECVREKGCPDKAAPPQGDDAELPVVRVSWDDAQRYAAWLSKKSPSRTYRLPTEAEWEFSARGGSTERYWWKNGRDFDAKHVSRDGRAILGSLGGSRKNLFGLYDVTGNVAEWVQDCYMNTYTKTTSADAVELPGCQKRVVRGGSWRDGPSALRITARSRISATLRDASIGFRIAATELKRGTEQ